MKDKKKEKTTSRMVRGHGNMAGSWRLVPETGVRGMSLSQALQDDARCLQDLLSLLQISGNLPDGKHPEIQEGVGGLYD
jgi:hypothetical protein